jgi:small subunit ribosomal protein S1
MERAMAQDDRSDSFASLFEAAASTTPQGRAAKVNVGDRCKAEVVRVGKDAVFVELVDPPPVGKRVQAFIELPELRDASGEVNIKPGDVLDAVVVEIDSRGSGMRLGRTMGKPQGIAELETAHQGRIPVEGKVVGVNKGGLEIEVAGARGFCPISQADRGFVQDPATLVGRTLSFLVTELKDNGKRIVLSRRAALEQEQKHAAAQMIDKLTIGAVVSGTISSVRDFGAFVDLGGVEGLIPNSQLSHDRSSKASDTVSAGDAVEVQVLEVQTDAVDKRGRPQLKITLSLKALSQDPWERIEQLAPEGKVAQGTVTRVLDFGAFVRIAPGIEGLLHVSELGGKVQNATAALKTGESLRVVVRSVDKAARKISLAPAAEGLEIGAEGRGPSFVIGALVNGVVDRLETYGVFLQIDGTRGRVGRGLIPNVELGTPRGADNRKLFPVGTKLTAKVLETGDGKLRLSLRAVKDDEERADFDGYRASTAAAGKLGTLADKLGSLLNKKR